MPSIEPQTFTYKTVASLAIEADVYRAHPSEKRPVLMWIHGGALIMGARTDLRPFQLERYLTAGFTVVAIDYRLAPETKLEAIIEDLRDAYRWILRDGPALFGLDGERVAIAGHSAGGYLTLMSGFGVEPRPKALVSFYGYGDITGTWYSRPDPFYSAEFRQVSIAEALVGISPAPVTQGPRETRRFFYYLLTRQVGRWPLEVAAHDPDRDPAWFIPYCPLQNVTAKYPPTLLIHGVPDTDVPYEQSVLMADEFKRQGVEHELLTLQELGHAFDMAEGAESSAEVNTIVDQAVAFLEARV